MQQINFIQVTPEELKNQIVQGVKEYFDNSVRCFPSVESAKKLMTKQEVADYFDVNLSTIYRWGKGRILSPKGVGGRVYFDREEVENLAVSLSGK